MAPLKSSLGRSLGKLLGVSKQEDLSLRGATQKSRKPVFPFSATGGTTATPGNGYKYHFFTAPAAPETFQVSGSPGTIDIFLVAGGGGGGWSGGNTPGSGGGGAGGLLELTSQSITVGTYPVQVGTGGRGGGPGSYNSAPLAPQPGTPTVFNSNTAYGGGRGAGHPQSGFTADPGGSGGGSIDGQDRGLGLNPGTGQPALDPFGLTFPFPQTQGQPGGIGPGQGGGGGGGAGNGTPGPGDGGRGDDGDAPGNAGNGGHGRVAFSGDTGIPSSYGTSGPAPGRYFAGGGGGAAYSGKAFGAAPPFGGGGAAGSGGNAGQANTGGGGGGGVTAGGPGADGVVIIRYSV